MFHFYFIYFEWWGGAPVSCFPTARKLVWVVGGLSVWSFMFLCVSLSLGVSPVMNWRLVQGVPCLMYPTRSAITTTTTTTIIIYNNNNNNNKSYHFSHLCCKEIPVAWFIGVILSLTHLISYFQMLSSTICISIFMQIQLWLGFKLLCFCMQQQFQYEWQQGRDLSYLSITDS